MQTTPPHAPFPAPRAEAPCVFWADVSAWWPQQPAHTRRGIVYRAGQTLRRDWEAGQDPLHLEIQLTAVEYDGIHWNWRPGYKARHDKRLRPAGHDALQSILMEWFNVAHGLLNDTECALFLRGVLRAEQLDLATIRDIEQQQREQIQHALTQQPADEYAGALVTERHAPDGRSRGFWAADTTLAPALLAHELQQAERACQQPLKETRRVLVFRATVQGRDTLVKRFAAPTGLKKIQGLVRPSAARRAWAAADTFEALHLPVPRPLGYLETGTRTHPGPAYMCCAFESDAITAREWAFRYYRQATDAQRTAFRDALRTLLLNLYRLRIDHADTKLSNILVKPVSGHCFPGPYQLLWIDWESVRFNVPPTQRRILRNMVQLNGSLRHSWLPDSERYAFLREMGRHFPFLLEPHHVRHLQRWTARRLRKEVRTRCGF